MKIDVLLADDHSIFLEAMKEFLEPFHRVVATAPDGATLISLAEKLRPAVTIMDLYMPQLGGLQACEELLKCVPETKVIFVTVSAGSETVQEAFRRGASGYVLKESAPDELLKAIEQVMAGGVYVTPSLTAGGVGAS